MIVAGTLWPSAAAVADDFQLNSYTTQDQGGPSAAATGDGDFVVAWLSAGSWGTDTGNSSGIQARRFSAGGMPLGPEFQVNTYTVGEQTQPSLALGADDRFVVVWFNYGYFDDLRIVQGQRYAADGTALGGEFAIGPAPDLSGDGQAAMPAVAMDSQGGFVTVWQAEGADGLEIAARRYAADGTPLGPPFLANSYTTSQQAGAGVQIAPDGRFTIVWQSETAPSDPFYSVQARQFQSDGTPLGPEFQVNTMTSGYQVAPRLGMDPSSGDFVVTWLKEFPTTQFDVMARRYAADGTPLGGEFVVKADRDQNQEFLAIAVAPGGEFVVAWQDSPADSSHCPCPIMARRFRSDGTPYAQEFRVNSHTTTGLTAPGSVVADAAGNFLVFWSSYGSPGTDTDGASAQGAREVSELTVSNDDGVTTAVPGGTLTYTVTAKHVTGLQSVVKATVSDVFWPSITCSWTCVGTAGGVCTPGPVTGAIADPVVLPVGSSVTYTASCSISPTATGSIVNTATISGPPGLFDPVPANDIATDVDGLQGLVIDDVTRLEGNSGATGFGFTVTLASPLGAPVTVDFGTSDGTATAGSDYLAASGTLTFAPGETTKPVVVGVLGDMVFEADETFFVTLSNAVGSAIVDGVGLGTILNDDSALDSGSLDELVPGSVETRSLETQPGPVAIAQEWRLRQAPHASYEVLVDAVTGDLGPDGPALERLASDGNVVQSAVGATGGSSRSLRFENHGPAVTDEGIRVQSRGCILDCDAADTFRIRLFETTLHGARFNNSATQLTVVVVQNASEEAVAGHVDFWSGAGVLLHSEPLALNPRQTLVLNTSTVGALQGQAGSVTVSHDGRYGALQGKAAAVEPATGFSFDTPLESRRR